MLIFILASRRTYERPQKWEVHRPNTINQSYRRGRRSKSFLERFGSAFSHFIFISLQDISRHKDFLQFMD